MSGGQLLPSTLVRGIEQLEPMPVTAQRLVALMQGEDVSLVKIAELVEFDQAIAASVLRLARSWAHAGSRPPETVRDAVVQEQAEDLADGEGHHHKAHHASACMHREEIGDDRHTDRAHHATE